MGKYMKFFKLSLITFIIAAFLTACGLNQPETVSTDQDPTVGEIAANTWARENLDLQAVGALLEKADDAEEFEHLLNSEEGVNNLDLNGDGYVDYISVREFDDRYDDQRGFSLFSMFGPDLIQEIAQIIFYRDRSDYPGSRVLLVGNDQIYGDDYYYETNWLDRSVPIASWIFTDRDSVYRSPYYYDYYPDYYEAYEVVETPVYVTRIQQYYHEPVFVRTAQPVYITNIKIKSPNKGKSWDKIYARLAKPNREQAEFKKNNPNKPAHVPVKKGDKKQFERTEIRNGNPKGVDRIEMPKGNPNRIERPEKIRIDRPVRQERQRPARNDKPGKSMSERQVKRGNPNRIARDAINPPGRVQQQQPVKQQKPQGNPSGPKNNPGGKGGGKGGGKKG
jgi:hypothetical protein